MQENLYSIIEWLAVLLNILYVILAARQKRFCWIVGGFASLISIFLFIHVKLYSEAVLYFIYVILSYYGWHSWQTVEEESDSTVLDLPEKESDIIEWNWKEHLLVISIGIAVALIISFIFKMTDASRPVFDAFTTSFSLIATYMTVKKVLSNWVYWILIDFATVFLYLSRALEVYAAQMFLFAILAAWGFITWLKAYKKTVLSE